MAKCNIIVADVFELSVAGKFQKAMIDRVKELYGPCLAAANAALAPAQKHTFDVAVATTAKPSVSELDFIIYLLPLEMSSIVRKKNGMTPQQNLLADHWGFTMTHSVGNTSFSAESELLHKSSDGAAMGSIVFHELLHYKTLKDNAALHGTGGLGAATVSAGSTLNSTNIRDIASTITRKITPWLDGWDDCVGALNLKKMNKDLFDIGL